MDLDAWPESLSGTVVADEGPPGAPGKDGVSGDHQVTVRQTVGAGKDATVSVKCDSGRVLGSGGWSSNAAIDQRPSGPANTGKTWRVSMTNLGSKAYNVTAYTICAKV